MEAVLSEPHAPSRADEKPEYAVRERGDLSLSAQAVVFAGAKRLDLQDLELTEPADNDIVVDVEWSGVSTGTERLLWSGEMPPFPGMAYPLVPGYESVGRVIWSKQDPDLVGR
ncbi:MAG: hypothetical protein ACX939_07825, partial [Hyphococcus sp.]